MSTRKFKKALVKSIEAQIEYWEKHQTEEQYIELRPLVESQLQQLGAISPSDAVVYQWCMEV